MNVRNLIEDAQQGVTQGWPEWVRRSTGSDSIPIAVIDGPYDEKALSGVLARLPTKLGDGPCSTTPNTGCDHGTYILGLLAARRDSPVPGLCPDCKFFHVPLFVDEHAPSASVSKLAECITNAIAVGAKLINLSLEIIADDIGPNAELAAALDKAAANGTLIFIAAGNSGRLATGEGLGHPATVPVAAVDLTHGYLRSNNFGPFISARGIAAIGHNVPGYAAGGGLSFMSGTSVATAVATGTVALIWSAYPKASAAEIVSALNKMAVRGPDHPPVLDVMALIAALNGATIAKTAVQRRSTRSTESGTEVTNMNWHSRKAATVIPAQTAAECECGKSANVGASSGTPVTEPPLTFIYVLGTVQANFPHPSLFAELEALARRLRVQARRGESQDDWVHRILSLSESRYIARQLCWTLNVEGVPAYSLVLNDLQDLPLLITSLERADAEEDLELIAGTSSLIPVEVSRGTWLPVLNVDHLTSFKQAELVDRLPASNKPHAAPEYLFKRLAQSADNLGETDEHRALNFIVVNYERIYEVVAEQAKADFILEQIEMKASRLAHGGLGHSIVDPEFTFRNTQTGVTRKYFMRIDTSHLFPRVVTELDERCVL